MLAPANNAYTSCPTFYQVPFLPLTPVGLVLKSLFVTSNQLSFNSLAYYTPNMLASFKQKHKW